MLFFLLFNSMCHQKVKKDEYVYKITDCVGLQSPMDIIYRDKKVGYLEGIKASATFCSGKLYFNEEFILTKNMRFYKTNLLFSNYIKIDGELTSDSLRSVPLTDTINIFSRRSENW